MSKVAGGMVGVVSNSSQDRASILVVDDNPLIVNVLNGLFSSVDYQVYCSANGKEALEVLNHKNIDVIICDVMMPEMDGYVFHSYVRDQFEYSHIPFVFLTALGSADDVCRGKEAGADDYVVKPFDPRELLAVVKGKVSRSRSLQCSADSRYDMYRKRVIHTLSHEFRTPLVAINTGTELLMEQQGKMEAPKVRGLIEAIFRGGQRLENLVNDFMLLQQIEAGIAEKLFTTRGKVCVAAESILPFLESQRGQVEAEGFDLRIEDLSTKVQVRVYEPHLHDILRRLLSNALKFSAEQRLVEVLLMPCSEELVIEIKDRGIGMDIERVKEAVDVFGQIDREKLEQQGGGLGLAIASRYANICGGKLEFDRREGGGSIVSLVLPIWQDIAEDPVPKS